MLSQTWEVTGGLLGFGESEEYSSVGKLYYLQSEFVAYVELIEFGVIYTARYC
jgi:hypothetical protein